MPDFLEKTLKNTGSKKGLKGRRLSAYIYGTMNKIGAMKGNKITPKGTAMEAKHAAKAKRTSGKRT